MRTILAALLALTAAVSNGVAADSPNILFLVADDLNCDLGCYGDDSAVTPHLDRLAEKGLVFERAYCQQAVCNPSRSSFLTGLRPRTVGVDDLRKYFRDTAPDGDSLVTLPEFFKNRGYFCQNIGKMYHNMGETQDRRSWSIDEVLYRGTHAADTLFGNRARLPDEVPPPYKAPVIEDADVPDSYYRDGQIARLAAAALRDFAESGNERPFFLAVGFWRPHLPFVAPKKYWDLHDPAENATPVPADPPRDVPGIALHISREIRGYGTVPKDRYFTTEEIARYRHGYRAAISFLDAQAGIVLDALSETGLDRETIVVFTSDHGFHVGELGLWGKTSNFERDARVPLILSVPPENGGSAPGQRTRALAELVDLYPTLADLAGFGDETPESLEGDSLAPVVSDPDTSVNDAAFTEHPHPFYGPRSNWKAFGYSIRTDRWRCTEWRSVGNGAVVARELYDHDSDQPESANVASEHPAVVEELSARLVEHFGL